MEPISLESLIKDNPPDGANLDCWMTVDFLDHHCLRDKKEGIVMYDSPSGYIHGSPIVTLEVAAEFLIRYGMRVGRWVLTACSQLKGIRRDCPGYTRTIKMVNCIQGAIVNCVQGTTAEWENAKGWGRKKTTTTLPTEISEFYNTTIRPFIESQTEFSTTIGSPYANSNTTSETLPQIESPSQSNDTIVYCVGGAVAAGVLISGIAAIAWTWKRKTLNEKRRKRYQEMVTSIVKSSENNSLDPPIPIV